MAFLHFLNCVGVGKNTIRFFNYTEIHFPISRLKYIMLAFKYCCAFECIDTYDVFKLIILLYKIYSCAFSYHLCRLPALLAVRTSQLPSSKCHDVLPTVLTSSTSIYCLTCSSPKAWYVPNVKELLCATRGCSIHRRCQGEAVNQLSPWAPCPRFASCQHRLPHRQHRPAADPLPAAESASWHQG